MSTAPSRYPLAWPPGRPRTKHRKAGSFRADGRPITVSLAISRLDDEVGRLGGRYPLLSTNLETRLDGTPILNRGMPMDPGVCAYFQLKGEPFALACDTFSEVAQNIAAIAAHIEATRRIERYGVASAAETLRAFSALPPPAGTVAPHDEPPPSWRALFNLPDSSFPEMEKDELLALVEARYRRQVAGASEAVLKTLNVARDLARRELK